MGEDFVYVYMKNGKCGFFPVSVLSSMKVSKVDADNTQHSDYRTQTIITSDTTLSISLSEIDSIVFVNKEVKPFPNTESEIRESIDLTNRIAEETNLRMDSLKEVGITDICIILDEIRRIDGVVFADVSTTQSIIHIIQKDGICINHLLNTCKLIPNEDYEQEITQLKGSALSPHRMNEIEENESIFIPQQGKALILAPFQDFFYKQINYWKEQLGRLYDVEDYVFLNEKADITKFKGDYLSQFDFILIDTHGANETLEVLKSDKDNLWYKKTFELYAPEKFTTALASRTEYSYDTVDDLVNKTKKLSWNQIILVHEDESNEVYLAMDKSFIEGHSFDGKIVFASACQSAKDRTSSTSLMKAFIDNGATIYIGFRETISPALAGDFNNGLLGFLTHGVSFGDFNKYWINSKYVAKVKESAIDCKYNEPIETLDPNLYTYKINPKYENYEIFLKNPYPSLNLPVIENGEIIFEWNTELEECSTIVHSIEEENDNFYSLNNNFTFKLNSDLYIDGNLYKHIIGKKNISVPVAEFSAGGHKWQISCYLEDSYGDKVCTYSSGLQDFTIPEPVVSSSESYAVYKAGTLTFYHDQLKNSRGGSVYGLNTGENFPDWGHYHRNDISKVVFDKSFANARPSTTSWWFYIFNLTTIENIEYLNTSEVTNMKGMFYACRNLTTLDVSNFNTRNATNMAYMFYECNNLTSLDLSNFKTENVTDMSQMFGACTNLTTLNVSNFNTAKVTDMACMFYRCNNLKFIDVGNFNTTNVTDMHMMFYHCKKLTSLDASNFKTENVTDMANMFDWCENLTALDVSKFNTAKVTNMANMFTDCSKITVLDVSKFNTKNVTNMYWMFRGCSNLTSLDVSNFDTRNVTDMSVMFDGCSSLTSLDVSSFDTRNVTNMNRMFDGCSSLTSLDVSSFDTRNVTNMNRMFAWCRHLASLDVSSFDTRNVTDMTEMFHGSSSLYTLDVSNFNMASCEKSESIFGYCYGLNTLAVSSAMENLDENACELVGYYAPCTIIAPYGFNFGVDTSGESFTWKSGYFKLGSGNTSILSFTVNGVSFKMVAVEGGTFMMGASDYDYEALSIDKPQHQVTLSSYYIGQMEVTQELWNAVMGTNPSHFKSSNKLPVECVSWDDCQRFISKLNNLTGETFSLPTEAQWEFAARGGNYSNDYIYSGSNSVDYVAWYNDNSGGKTHNVANKVPNELGLYDMSGNVAEWCQDYLGDYSSNSQTNPSGPSSGSTRINRGGHWNSVPASCLVYKRKYAKPGDKYNSIGLRLVL